MSLRVAIQMDPLESVNIDGDTTFALAEVAQARGMELFVYGPDDMSIEQGRVTALVRPARVQRVKDAPGLFDAPVRLDLAKDVDVILMRQDPPFDMSYITACHLLEEIADETLVVNDPAGVRSSPEKIFPLMYPDLMPPTLVSRDLSVIEAFRAEHKDIIIKPLYGNGGAGVFHVAPDDENLNALLEMFADIYREPIIAQAYLPDVRAGDKRIILIDGKAAGAINRIPEAGEARANMHAGAEPVKTTLTDRDKEICDAIGPELKARGLIFVGIDVIGGYLTEINVTSPTGLQEINRFDGVNLEAQIWDAIEAKL